MSQSPQYDFSTPQRQSTVAILLVVFKTLRVLFRQIALPFLVFVFMGKKSSDFGTYFVIFISGISLVSMIYSIINHFRSYYYISHDELIVHSGILGKKKLSIPLERIQSINFEQNLIHRLFRVKKLKLDTAGTGEKEMELAAIDSDKAEALRSLLIHRSHTIPVAVAYSAKHDDLIFQLGFVDLIRAGFVENHLKSGGLIFVFLWWMYANLQEVGINAEDYIEDVQRPSFSITLYTLGIGFFLLLSLVISMVRTIFKYYNLHLKRSGNGFVIQLGLFNTQTISALDHKIQTVSWSDNLLKKILKIHDLRLKQASNKEVESKESITVPGCSINHIEEVCAYVFPGWVKDDFRFSSVSKAYLWRSYYFSVLLVLLIIAISWFFESYASIYAAIVLLCFLILMSYLGYKKLGYSINDKWIYLKGGAFGDKNVVSAIYKTQSIKISQNPFQKKKNLVNLTLYNASGSESIPFIDQKTAYEMANSIIFKVETDKRSWM